MLKHIKRLSAVVLGLSFIFTACSPNQSKTETNKSAESNTNAPVTIRFAHGWSQSGDTAVAAEFVTKFANEHKDSVNLVEEVVAGDEMLTKIKVDIAGNNLPDAWMYWGSMADSGNLIKSGLLADMSEYFEESEKTKRSDYPEVMFDSFRFNDKIYGIPTESYMGYWFCNKELFEKYNLEYPKTYEELLEVSKVFNENGIVPLAMGSKAGNPAHFFVSELFCQYDGAVDNFAKLTNDWKIDNENFRKVIDLIADMKKNNVFPADTVANGDWGPSFALYNEEKAAMVYTMTWQLNSLKPEIEAKSVQIDVPKMPGSTVDPSTIVSSNSTYGLVFNAKSFADPAKRKILIELADVITSDEWVETMFYKTGMMSSKNMKNIDKSKMEVPILFSIMDNAKGREKMSCHWLAYPDGEPFNYFAEKLDELFAGSMTPEEFVNGCQKSLDEAKAEQ
jgi:hypothetical protein